LRQALEAWEKGTNTDKTAKVPANNNQDGRQPAILMTAPAGIAAATAGSMTLTTGANLDQVAQRDTHQTSGRRWIHNARESISHFVGGTKGKIALKQIAANGNIQTQAQAGEIEITGDKTVTVTSVGDSVHVNAAKEILLTCGGAYVRIADGNIEVHAPGRVSIKGAKKVFAGPDSMTLPPPALPHGELTPTDLAFRLVDPWGRPVPGAPYKAILSDGSVRKGVLDAAGAAKLCDIPPGVTASVNYGEDIRKPVMEVVQRVAPDWNALLSLDVSSAKESATSNDKNGNAA
jgi:type VI secretion system secreted protein VgrG